MRQFQGCATVGGGVAVLCNGHIGSINFKYQPYTGMDMLGQSNIPAETVTKECKNCEDLFKEEIAGNGTCLGQFCSVACENEWSNRRPRGPVERGKYELHCPLCAEADPDADQKQWVGRVHGKMKATSTFGPHVMHVHDTTIHDSGVKPYVYDREDEVWKREADDGSYWEEIPENEVPEVVKERRNTLGMDDRS